jgi:hypothetical protein
MGRPCSICGLWWVGHNERGCEMAGHFLRVGEINACTLGGKVVRKEITRKSFMHTSSVAIYTPFLN